MFKDGLAMLGSRNDFEIDFDRQWAANAQLASQFWTDAPAPISLLSVDLNVHP